MKLLTEKKYLENGGTLMFPMPYHIVDKNGEKNFKTSNVV